MTPRPEPSSVPRLPLLEPRAPRLRGWSAALCVIALSMSSTVSAQTPMEPRAGTPPTEAAQDANAANTDETDAATPTAVAATTSGTAVPAPDRRLRVGVAGSPPFNFVGPDGEAAGPSLEIWSEVAAEHGWEYDVEVLPNVGEAIDRVARGDLDVAIGPISITAERASRVSFTQPYWQADLAILSLASEGSSIFDPELIMRVLRAAGFLLFILILVGGLIFLAERQAQSFNTFGDAVWFALVTMTTVGYGDRVPVTRVGRILTSLWMLFAMIFGASLTAQIATALTLAQLSGGAISSADDLRGKHVASKEGSTALDFARTHRAHALPAADLDAAVELLLSGRADAVVFDRPALQYQVAQRPDSELVISEAGYDAQGYGFAFSVRSPLRRETDIALLSLRERGRLTAIGEAWIQGTRSVEE